MNIVRDHFEVPATRYEIVFSDTEMLTLEHTSVYWPVMHVKTTDAFYAVSMLFGGAFMLMPYRVEDENTPFNAIDFLRCIFEDADAARSGYIKWCAHRRQDIDEQAAWEWYEQERRLYDNFMATFTSRQRQLLLEYVTRNGGTIS